MGHSEPALDRSAGAMVLRFLIPFGCFMLLGAGGGLLYAETGDAGYLGRGLDVIAWTPVGAVAGALVGAVVGVVLALYARWAQKTRKLGPR